MKARGNLGLLRDEENNFFPEMNTPPQKFIGHVQGILISGRRIGYIICFALILFVIYFVWFSPLVMEHSPGLKKLSSDNSHFVCCFDNLTTLSLHNELFYLLVLLVYLFICYIYLTLSLNFMGFFYLFVLFYSIIFSV